MFIYEDDFIELQVYLKECDINSKYPADTLRRFAIGFYQIYQGIEWKDNASADESFAAAALHFLTVGERLSLSIENYIPRRIAGIHYVKNRVDWKKLMWNLSKAQALLVYSTNTDNIKRKARYDPDKLAEHLGSAINTLIGMIEKEKRQQAIETAIAIMTGVL